MTYCEPSWALQAASLLHDVIEDTSTTREHIARVFGQEVATYVCEVSDVSKPSDGNRKTRKLIDCEHLRKASLNGKRLKCADFISNTKTIAKYDIKFAMTYLEEKLAVMISFYDECHEELIYKKAMSVCGKAFREIYPDETVYNRVMKRLLKDQSVEFIEMLEVDV